MRQSIRKIWSIAICLVSILPVLGQTTLNVNLANGQTTYYLFTDNPVITWSGDNGIKLITKNTSKEYSISSLKDLTIGKAEATVSVSGITLSETSASVTVGDTMTITATVTPANATNSAVVWSSSNNSVATVSDGTITAIAVGTATITCTAADGSGVSATCAVTVTEKSSGITPTDISSILNTMYIPATEVQKGNTATLVLNMKNAVDITSYQVTVELPEGITIAHDPDDAEFLLADISGSRTSSRKHSFVCSEHDGNKYLITCASSNNYTFTGNDGEVATITLSIADKVVAGDYAVKLTGQVMTESGTNKSVKPNDVTCKLTITDYIVGDANADGELNISDYSMIISYLHGTAKGTYNVKAMDTNGDGEINISDASGVITLLHK